MLNSITVPSLDRSAVHLRNFVAMGSFSWLVAVATLTCVFIPYVAFGQTIRPNPPTDLLVDGAPSDPGTCSSGEIADYPNCFPSPPAPAADGKSWAVTFAEEFDGTALDTNKLSPCFDWNFGNCTSSFNTGKEHYDPGQVQISNGTAKLVAEPLSPPRSDSSCYQGSCTYKAGLLSTARPRADDGSPYLFPFTYGYVESRMKYPGISGFFTAFWMLPTNPSYDYDTEIDIVEILGGDPDQIWMHYHHSSRSQYYRVNSGNNDNGACAHEDYSGRWVTFGLDWQENHVAWYINGAKCGEYKGDSSTIEDGPMQLILHMMVDNEWERNVGLVLADQSEKATLEVDYIRVYQQQ